MLWGVLLLLCRFPNLARLANNMTHSDSIDFRFTGGIAGFRALLCGILRCRVQQRERVRFDWAVGPVRNKTQKENNMLEVKITNDQEVDVTITPKTDTGKPAKLDGSPAVSVISGNSTFTQSEDGLTLTLRSSDDPGDTEFLVKADADIGEGVEEISEIIKLSVAGATAKNLGLTVGTPRAKT